MRDGYYFFMLRNDIGSGFFYTPTDIDRGEDYFRQCLGRFPDQSMVELLDSCPEPNLVQKKAELEDLTGRCCLGEMAEGSTTVGMSLCNFVRLIVGKR